MNFKRIMPLLFAVFAWSAAARASTVFNFDGDSLGTSTNFTDTANGLSATFSSAADPGGFVIYSSMFDTLTGNVLGDPGPAGQDNLALDISFNSELNAIELDFATSDFSAPSPFTLSAYQNSQLVGSTTTSGMFLNGFVFPEGEIGFGGANFNNVVISSPAMDFAVDNINVNPVPEPGPFSLIALGVGFLIAGSVRVKRRARRLA
jgi:hypothetical protein